jgi:hypothetical protein
MLQMLVDIEVVQIFSIYALHRKAIHKLKVCFVFSLSRKKQKPNKNFVCKVVWKRNVDVRSMHLVHCNLFAF